MPTADALAQRLATLFRRFGQTATITHAGVAATVQCRVSTLSLSVRAVYFKKADYDLWAAPAYQVTIPGEYTALALGDPITLPNGVASLSIRGWDYTRLGPGVVKTVVFVARPG
jgi:hypothetical protein